MKKYEIELNTMFGIWWEQLKDGDGTEITVGDCVDDVLEFLKELEKENV